MQQQPFQRDLLMSPGSDAALQDFGLCTVSAGDVADNFYYLYHNDIALMQASGIKSFRFSISWPRIYPYGAGQVMTPLA